MNLFDEEAGDKRADESGDEPGGREHAKHFRVEGRWEFAGDHHVEHHDCHAAADALEQSAEDEDPHVRGDDAKQDADNEEHATDQQRLEGAGAIGKHTAERHADQRGGQCSGEGERRPLFPGEIGCDDGQGRGDGIGLESDERDQG